MREIRVALGARSYPVLIGPGARHELSGVVPEGVRRAVVVTQEAVQEAGWLQGLNPGVPFEVCTIAAGEATKTIHTVEELCRRFAQSGLSRADVVVGMMSSTLAAGSRAGVVRPWPSPNLRTSLGSARWLCFPPCTSALRICSTRTA